MRNRLFWIVAVCAGVALAMLPAQATPTPVFVSGNSNCASVGSTGTQVSVAEPTQNVTLNVAGGQIFVTDVHRRDFDFSTAGVVVVDVVVKGSGANWYHYSPATAGDVNLMIPNGNKLNLVHFCYTAAPNNPPVAVDDSASVVGPATVDVDVLSNDSDGDGDTLTIASLQTSTDQGGTAAVVGGQVRYTPPSDFNGEDTFTYQANDGEDLSNLATVTVTVFAGELTCSDENSNVPIDEGGVVGFINRLENTDDSTCVAKPYLVDVSSTEDGDEVTFIPVDVDEENPQPAAYEAELTFGSNPSDNPFTRTLEYDPEDDGTFIPMPWCTGDPYQGDTIDPSVIPGTGDDRWCIVSAFTEVASATETGTTWAVVGVGDPTVRGR